MSRHLARPTNDNHRRACKASADAVSIVFRGVGSRSGVSVRLIDDEIRARPCSEAFNLVMRGSRVVKTAQTKRRRAWSVTIASVAAVISGFGLKGFLARDKRRLSSLLLLSLDHELPVLAS